MNDNQAIINFGGISNTCFVVMLFHSLFESEYERVIRPAIEESGLECVRGDEIYTEQAIVQDIWKSIRNARVIVAELSGRNPNVMYETGLAHAIGKPIIMLTRDQQDVPFDLRSLRYIYYDPNNPFWGDDLRTELTKFLLNVLESPAIGVHLNGIELKIELPEAPKNPIKKLELIETDFSGVWNASWLSVSASREHKATLVIPPDHGSNFMATMTVTYIKSEIQSIIQETLTGNIRDSGLSLSGVNYTYIEQGNSRAYSLDSFDLKLSEDKSSLSGKAILKNGAREVSFKRVNQAQHV